MRLDLQPRTSTTAGGRVAALGGLIVCISGCLRPYHYSPRFPAYQGPAAPIQTLQPGPYYSPGQPVMPSPTYGTPSFGQPSLGAPTFNGGVQPTPAQPTPAPTNTFENNGGDFGGGDFGGGGFDGGSGGTDFDLGNGSGGDVPYYQEPGAGFEDPSGGFEDPIQTSPDDFGGEFDLNKPVGPSAMAPVPEARPIAPLGDDPFGGVRQASAELAPQLTPITAPAAAPTAALPYLPQTIGETRLNPYAYEEGTYAWVRGVVSRDAVDGSWSITYDLEPQAFDEYGGHLTLAADDRLAGLDDGEVVLIEGSVDAAALDRFGKPLYRIGEVVKLDVRVAD